FTQNYLVTRSLNRDPSLPYPVFKERNFLKLFSAKYILAQGLGDVKVIRAYFAVKLMKDL
ncbi:MAG: hypothetical protein SCJ97_07270, partial [Bacillota bacterium]|nr:hypothetical protein [Bacillota bacterium]